MELPSARHRRGDGAVAAWAADGAGTWRAGGRPAMCSGARRPAGRDGGRGEGVNRGHDGPGAHSGSTPRAVVPPRGSGCRKSWIPPHFGGR
eukprot:2518847-Alexandrium_andersonii.AAC.1